MRNSEAPACPNSAQAPAERERGQALFMVVLFMVVTLAIGGSIVTMATLNTRRVVAKRSEQSLVHAARLGLAQGKFLLWDAYQEDTTEFPTPEDKPGNITKARAYFDDVSKGNLLAASGGGGSFAGGDARLITSMRLSGHSTLGAYSEPIWVKVRAERHDTDAKTTFIVLRSVATSWDTGSSGGLDPAADRAARVATGLPADQRISEIVYRLGGEPYKGFEFALLTNAVNCTFCHADFDNAKRYYDPGTGTYERIKVASLQEMRVGFQSGGSANTNIAGTLFVQGNIQDIDGDDLDPGSVSSLQSRPFGSDFLLDEVTPPAPGTYTGTSTAYSNTNTVDESVVDPDDAFATSVAFADGAKDGDGNYTQADANLYENYPTDAATQESLAGRLPAVFPPVIDDSNSNNVVDDTEWTTHTTDNTFDGTITLGAGTEGVIHITNSYGSSTLPTAGTNNAPGSVLTGGTTAKSVILIGTESDPIVIDGDVAIDGDVVIGGVVKGSGQLLARGNMYILGDLRYNDDTSSGSRNFGTALDGTENSVAYAAGGVIVHGQFLTDNAGNSLTGERDGGGDVEKATPEATGRSFTQNELGLWNRQEYAKTMPYVDAVTGWPTSNPVAADGTTDNTVAAQTNPLYKGSDYVPRFYTLKEHEGLATGDEGRIWLHGAEPYGTGSNPNPNQTSSNPMPYSWLRLEDTDSDGTPDKALWMNYDIQGNAYEDGSTPLQEVLANETGDRATDISGGGYSTIKLDPSFTSQDNLRAMLAEFEAARASSSDNGQPFRLDGLFYTNNGMLFMARDSTSSDGHIEFNGSVVAADTGILAGSHLQLNYDVRTASHLKIEDRSTVDLYVVVEREGQ